MPADLIPHMVWTREDYNLWCEELKIEPTEQSWEVFKNKMQYEDVQEAVGKAVSEVCKAVIRGYHD